MPEAFLDLPQGEQSAIYRGLAERLARRPIVLEKDVWVCWALQTLFDMPGRPGMVFKGGTSLSKVYRAIDRFSEDIDITLDLRDRGDGFNPFAEGVSNNRIRRFAEELGEYVQTQVREVVLPHFSNAIARLPRGNGGHVELVENGDAIRIHYPAASGDDEPYLGNSILVEFGGRNSVEPNEAHEVQPDIAPELPTLTLPRVTVTVLSAKRTFWEKATLMHVACNRPSRWNGDRYSRHWYDLARLSEHAIGADALANRDLLADVVKYKKVYFHSAYADYDACVDGRIRLIPDEPLLTTLAQDYKAMVDSGMFVGAPPTFEELIGQLKGLEGKINERR